MQRWWGTGDDVETTGNFKSDTIYVDTLRGRSSTSVDIANTANVTSTGANNSILYLSTNQTPYIEFRWDSNRIFEYGINDVTGASDWYVYKHYGTGSTGYQFLVNEAAVTLYQSGSTMFFGTGGAGIGEGGNGEMYALDDSGNSTKISSHEEGEPVYYSTNKITGESYTWNWIEVIKALEQVAGKTLITYDEGHDKATIQRNISGRISQQRETWKKRWIAENTVKTKDGKSIRPSMKEADQEALKKFKPDIPKWLMDKAK
jgi:hypothetical protein